MLSKCNLINLFKGVLVSFTVLSILAGGVYSQRESPSIKAFRLL